MRYKFIITDESCRPVDVDSLYLDCIPIHDARLKYPLMPKWVYESREQAISALKDKAKEFNE